MMSSGQCPSATPTATSSSTPSRCISRHLHLSHTFLTPFSHLLTPFSHHSHTISHLLTISRHLLIDAIQRRLVHNAMALGRAMKRKVSTRPNKIPPPPYRPWRHVPSPPRNTALGATWKVIIFPSSPPLVCPPHLTSLGATWQVIMPKMYCWCDRFWNPMIDCRMPGVSREQLPMPFHCPFDHVYAARRMNPLSPAHVAP